MSKLEEIKGIYGDYKELQEKNDFKQADLALLYISENHMDWLIQQAEEKQELEEKVKELNREIGSYAGQVGEKAQSIGADLTDLKILATRMCKADD